MSLDTKAIHQLDFASVVASQIDRINLILSSPNIDPDYHQLARAVAALSIMAVPFGMVPSASDQNLDATAKYSKIMEQYAMIMKTFKGKNFLYRELLASQRSGLDVQEINDGEDSNVHD